VRSFDLGSCHYGVTHAKTFSCEENADIDEKGVGCCWQILTTVCSKRRRAARYKISDLGGDTGGSALPFTNLIILGPITYHRVGLFITALQCINTASMKKKGLEGGGGEL
jgi:hypothetical protein